MSAGAMYRPPARTSGGRYTKLVERGLELSTVGRVAFLGRQDPVSFISPVPLIYIVNKTLKSQKSLTPMTMELNFTLELQE